MLENHMEDCSETSCGLFLSKTYIEHMFRDSKMSISIGTLLEEEERGGCIAVRVVFRFCMEP